MATNDMQRGLFLPKLKRKATGKAGVRQLAQEMAQKKKMPDYHYWDNPAGGEYVGSGTRKLIATRYKGKTYVSDPETKEQLRHGGGMHLGKLEGDTQENIRKRVVERYRKTKAPTVGPVRTRSKGGYAY